MEIKLVHKNWDWQGYISLLKPWLLHTPPTFNIKNLASAHTLYLRVLSESQKKKNSDYFTIQH